ncbi:MAG: M28 family peptidase [Cyclobacteriaceae bacterium]|nr:M28 family peptidase [Cyclobacteriaceae bacterium]
MRIKFLTIIIVAGLFSCSSDKEKKASQGDGKPSKVVSIPNFNADSAYFFIQKQVDFKPRIPNSEAHKKAGDFFIEQFKAFGAEVTVQEFEATSYDNTKLFLRNIIASFNPQVKKRILLAAHWDTRPFADKDLENPKVNFDGANDGASGVGVLLEVARVISHNTPPEVGVDIILFDGEDWGFDTSTAKKLYNNNSDFKLPKNLDSWWCLGSQHWSKNKHVPNYSAYYGILLDMVGGKNAVFVREGTSMEYAPGIVDKVWKAAGQLGHGHIFINKREGAITDDHVFVNEIAKIPMINIVHYDPAEGYFGDFHHSRKDNMDLISKETLNAVGNTLLQVIYYE